MTDFKPASVPTGAHTLPGPLYTDPDVFRRETERLFYRGWLCVGRADAIPTPGDYLVAHVIAESILVVRDRLGALRAFYNVCRHRGSRLCTAPTGHLGGVIQCPYHAWTYDLDGRLLTARLMQDVPGFCAADYPLHPVALAVWEGFIFLRLTPGGPAFAAAYPMLDDRFAPWSLPTLRPARRIEYDINANWKLVVENYSECYHCALIHPELCELSSPTSGRNDLLEGPVLGGYMTLNAAHASMTVGGRTARPPLGSVANADLQRVYYYSIFPNLLLSLHPDYVMAHVLWPLAVDRTRIVCEWYFDPGALSQPEFDPSDAVEFWDRTNRQDWRVCELAHQGLSSRSYTPGPYAQSEGLLHAFDREYLRAMDTPSATNRSRE